MTATFVTPQGLEVPAVTAQQMREVDRIALEETGPNLYQMMENAGRNLALSAIDLAGGDWSNRSVAVLAGTGGNGGGGICAARHLANRGVDVTVVLTDESRLGEVPRQQLSVYRSGGGRVTNLKGSSIRAPGLIVDAVVGYSLTGALRGAALDLVDWANNSGAPVLSLDVPSGLDSTTGESEGQHVAATRTLTLALPKTGLGGAGVGDLYLGDIGIPRDTYRRAGVEVPAGLFGDAFTIRLHHTGWPGLPAVV